MIKVHKGRIFGFSHNAACKQFIQVLSSAAHVRPQVKSRSGESAKQKICWWTTWPRRWNESESLTLVTRRINCCHSVFSFSVMSWRRWMWQSLSNQRPNRLQPRQLINRFLYAVCSINNKCHMPNMIKTNTYWKPKMIVCTYFSLLGFIYSEECTTPTRTLCLVALCQAY